MISRVKLHCLIGLVLSRRSDNGRDTIRYGAERVCRMAFEAHLVFLNGRFQFRKRRGLRPWIGKTGKNPRYAFQYTGKDIFFQRVEALCCLMKVMTILAFSMSGIYSQTCGVV